MRTSRDDRTDDGAHEAHVGRWSRRIGEGLLRWLDPGEQGRLAGFRPWDRGAFHPSVKPFEGELDLHAQDGRALGIGARGTGTFEPFVDRALRGSRR